MGTLHLAIEPAAYELAIDGRVLARLEGGSEALLAGARAPLRPVDIEAAIERSEEWLMPFSRAVQGFALVVRGAQGELRARVGDAARLSPQEVEAAFTRAFDDVAFGRGIAPQALAGLVLVRELMHHGRLASASLSA